MKTTVRFSLKRGFWIWKSCLKIRSQSFFMWAQTYRYRMFFSEKCASLKIMLTLHFLKTRLRQGISAKSMQYGSLIYIYWVPQLCVTSLLTLFRRKKSQSFTIFLKFQWELNKMSTLPNKKIMLQSLNPNRNYVKLLVVTNIIISVNCFIKYM